VFLTFLSGYFSREIVKKKEIQKKIKPGFGVSVLHQTVVGW